MDIETMQKRLKEWMDESHQEIKNLQSQIKAKEKKMATFKTIQSMLTFNSKGLYVLFEHSVPVKKRRCHDAVENRTGSIYATRADAEDAKTEWDKKLGKKHDVELKSWIFFQDPDYLDDFHE